MESPTVTAASCSPPRWRDPEAGPYRPLVGTGRAWQTASVPGPRTGPRRAGGVRRGAHRAGSREAVRVHIVIGGCGRLGAEIADQLSTDPDTDVVVVDVDVLAFDRLGSAFNGETVVGDCTDRDVLEQAGVARADGLIAVTRSDNANLMAVEIATHLYEVPRTIARLFNPDRESVYRKLGVRYVSSTGTIAKLFLNEFRDESYPLHVHFTDSEAAIVDLEIDTGGHGTTVAEFQVDGLLRVAAIRRGARVFLPDDSDRLERDDVVTVAMKPAAHRAVAGLVREPFDHRRAREE
ncbi:TrkA family potassium uptake protein [Nitriliruptoraceae bacterium ZYF776]|nr:TrkA family potassium uptake protein [Profundirhabdus halotolerans]